MWLEAKRSRRRRRLYLAERDVSGRDVLSSFARVWMRKRDPAANRTIPQARMS
jgi:hypothetical protein